MIIKQVTDMLRLNNNNKYIVEVLTDEESKMTPSQLKAHLRNLEIKNNNDRIDELLKVNEIL